jgi:hypothetical protein
MSQIEQESICFVETKKFLCLEWNNTVLHSFRITHNTPKGMIAVCNQCGKMSKEVFD